MAVEGSNDFLIVDYIIQCAPHYITWNNWLSKLKWGRGGGCDAGGSGFSTEIPISIDNSTLKEFR